MTTHEIFTSLNNRMVGAMDCSRGKDMREEFMERVEMLRNKAPDERTRMKFDKFLNDLR